MQIGEKIKKLRTAKLMTQNELVGGEITRNMLSRIENGAAQPSMATVKYIAQRLNVSVGFLLAEEEDEILYFKSAEINNIKKALSFINQHLSTSSKNFNCRYLIAAYGYGYLNDFSVLTITRLCDFST